MYKNPLNKELKNCPFCGGKAEIRMNKYGGSYVVCTSCYCQTADGGMGIVKCYWNRRVEDERDNCC